MGKGAWRNMRGSCGAGVINSMLATSRDLSVGDTRSASADDAPPSPSRSDLHHNRSGRHRRTRDTFTPSGISNRSTTAVVSGSTLRTSLTSSSHVACHNSPSTHVTPVTNRSDLIARRTTPGSGSICVAGRDARGVQPPHSAAGANDQFDITPRALERVARRELLFSTREVTPVDGCRPALREVKHRDQHVRMLLPGETSQALQILLAIDRRDDDASAPASNELGIHVRARQSPIAVIERVDLIRVAK